MRRLGLFATLVCLWIGSSASAQILVTDFTGNLTSYNPTTNTSNSINNTLAQPGGMAIGPDGLVYISNMATGTVDRYNPYTGAFVSNVANPTTLGPDFQPAGLQFGSGPNAPLYISNQVSFPFSTPPPFGGVVSYNIDTQTPTPILTNMVQPNSLLYHGGNLYISELRNYTGHVVKYDFVNPATEFIANLVDGGPLSASAGMAIGPDGWLYVADVLANEIRRFDLNDPTNNSVFIASSPDLQSPTDLAFYDGSLYVSNVGSGMAPDGFLSKFNWTTGAFESIAVANLFYGSAVTVVPEPTSLALVGISTIGWLWRRRRIA